MQSLLVVAQNTFRETVRDKILYNLVFFALLLIGASVLLGTLTIGEQARIINDVELHLGDPLDLPRLEVAHDVERDPGVQHLILTSFLRYSSSSDSSSSTSSSRERPV